MTPLILTAGISGIFILSLITLVIIYRNKYKKAIEFIDSYEDIGTGRYGFYLVKSNSLYFGSGQSSSSTINSNLSI